MKKILKSLRGGGGRYKSPLTAFTLAEVMVVMLILSIILAAFAPMMTARKKVDLSSPWRYSDNNSDAYFGLASNQTALIGAKVADTTVRSRLMISTSADDQAHMLFRQGTTRKGALRIFKNNFLMGSDFTSKMEAGVNYNTAFGIGAQATLVEGADNTAVGFNALKNNGYGRDNTAVGSNALSMLDDYLNTAVGSNAMSQITYGTDNTAVGFEAMGRSTNNAQSGTSNNTAIGSRSLSNNKGGYNTAVGALALQSNTTGKYNTAIGNYALATNQTGNNNTAIGNRACYHVLGSNKICIGSNSGPSAYSFAGVSTDEEERIYIGRAANGQDSILTIHNTAQNPTVVIEGNLVVNGTVYGNGDFLARHRFYADNNYNGGFRHTSEEGSAVVGYDNYNPWLCGYAQDCRSDIRLKNVKGENKAGLEEIRKLKIYDYSFKDDKKKTPHVGVMAQELQKIFPKAVTKNYDGYLLIRQEDMFYGLINAVKELDNYVKGILTELKKVVTDIKNINKRLDEQDKRILELEKQNAELRDLILKNK